MRHPLSRRLPRPRRVQPHAHPPAMPDAIKTWRPRCNAPTPLSYRSRRKAPLSYFGCAFLPFDKICQSKRIVAPSVRLPKRLPMAFSSLAALVSSQKVVRFTDLLFSTDSLRTK
jgi:hypothetical protein